MSFAAQHQIFRDAVRRFVREQIDPYVEKWEEAGEIPRSLFRQMGALGLLGVEYPEHYGGGGADLWMSVVLAEELARCRAGGVAFSVIVHTDMSSPWLAQIGNEAQKARYLPGIISGQTVCALAITEPGAGSDMAGIETRAVQDRDEWVITGAKTFTTNGVYGDLYFVAARTAPPGEDQRHRGISQFLVQRDTPGVTVTKKMAKTGMLSSDTAELSFDGVRVPAANLLGEQGRGFQQLAAGLQRERLMVAVMCVAASEQALGDTRSYLKQRQAFEKPLAAKQGLQHKIADMATRIEAARAMTYHAIEAFAAGKECAKEVSMAKLFASETAVQVGYDAVQMHGGYGYMRETPVERFARDYRVWTIAAGTSEIMRDIIAQRLID
jgi:acyl-CoA dehydrogenase